MSSLSLNNAEKEALKNRTLAMSQDEKIYTAMFYPTELLQAELIRREESITNMLAYVWDAAASMNDHMTINEKEALYNDIIETINQDS